MTRGATPSQQPRFPHMTISTNNTSPSPKRPEVTQNRGRESYQANPLALVRERQHAEPSPPPRPRLRGVLHQAGFGAALLVGIVFLGAVDGRRLVAAAAFVASRSPGNW